MSAVQQEIMVAEDAPRAMGRPASLVISSGMRFGRLVAVALSEVRLERKRTWLCQCDCGRTKIVRAVCLRNGQTKSCGCGVVSANIDRAQHNLTRSSEHKIWRQIIQRCENPGASSYKNYGGRGVRICAEWRASFLSFLESVGPRPSRAHSIDREDTNGHYEPSNCRWSDRKTQGENTRKSRFWIVDGVTYPSAKAAGDAFGISAGAMMRRCNGYRQGGKSYPPMQNHHSVAKYGAAK